LDIIIKDGKFIFQFDASTGRSAEIARYGINRRYSRKTNKTKFWCDVTPYNWGVLKKEFPNAAHKYDDSEIKAVIKRYEGAQQFKVADPDTLIARFKKAGYVFKKYEPLPYQANGIAFSIAAKRTGLYYDTGLGKTYVGAIMTDFLKMKGLIEKTLVICPKALIRRAWMDDLKKFTNLNVINARDDGFSDVSGDIYLINPESIKKKPGGKGVDVPVEMFDMLFFDESSLLKNGEAQITKWILSSFKDIEYLVLASGTPAPNKFLEYWGQMKAIDGCMGDSQGRMRDRFYFQPRPDKHPHLWVPRPGAESDVKKLISHCTIWARRDECLSLPPYTIKTVEIEMSKVQKRHYNDIKQEMMTLIEEKIIDAKNELVVRQKLLQVLNGFIINTEEGETIPIPGKNKKIEMTLDIASQIIDNQGHNLIVWGVYRNDIEMVYAALSKKWKGAILYGGMSEKRFNGNIDSWMDDPDCRFVVAHPKSVKFGLTWNKACYSIRYSATESYEDYYQSAARNYRHGQTKPVTEIVLQMIGTVEDNVAAALKSKEGLLKFFSAK